MCWRKGRNSQIDKSIKVSCALYLLKAYYIHFCLLKYITYNVCNMTSMDIFSLN